MNIAALQKVFNLDLKAESTIYTLFSTLLTVLRRIKHTVYAP